MKQEKIKYSDIMNLGFKEVQCNDSVYEKEHGFPYCIITKKLTKVIYLDWQKDTKLCMMVRLYNVKTGDIAAQLPIENLAHLNVVIDFFTKNNFE
jgi:hypothetical protein